MNNTCLDPNKKANEEVKERINRIMVGRFGEMKMFQKQFDRVLEGGMGLTVVSGRPGIGKTFFAERAVSLSTGGNATYLHGKFRQYENTPLLTVSEVIEQAVKHLLTLPAEPLRRIQNDLSQSLNTDAAIILAVCPYAGILLGPRKAINTDSLEQLKYRVRKAVGKFLEIVSTALFPLVIFFDDLQWADTLSLYVIKSFCRDYGYFNLHLILAYKDSAAGKVNIDPAKFPAGEDSFIGLGGLDLEDIERYLRLVFRQDIEHKDYLTRILYGLTLGNPFNLDRILRLLLKENAVVYSQAQKWLVRPDKIDKLNLPADIERLLQAQIDGLKSEDKKLLELIACCGGEVKLGLLARLTAGDGAADNTPAVDASLKKRLDRLCQNSLLAVNRQGGGLQAETGYGFPHDIVLRLVYHMLTPEEKSGLHYHIAGILSALSDESAEPIAGPSADLAVAGHLLHVDRNLLRKDDASKWIGTLYRAGRAARQGAAVEQALEIFGRCAELLSAGDDTAAADLVLDVRLELGECQYICGQAEEAGQSFEALIAEYPAVACQVRIKRKYINLCAFNGDFEKVMALGLEILNHLDFKVDLKSLIPDLIKSRLLLNSRKIRWLKDAPAITDERLLVILETLTVMAPSANRIGDRMSALIALKLTILSARHGNSDYAPVAYASYVYVLFHLLKDPEKGRELEDVTLTFLEKSESVSSRYVALCIIGSLTRHWAHSLADTIACLERSVTEGEKADASLYSSYAITFSVITRFMTGAPLRELKQYIANNRSRRKRLEHYLTNHIYAVYENQIRWLEEGAAAGDEALFAEEDRDKKLFADTIKLNGDMIRLQRLYLEGQTREAYGLAEEIGPEVSLHKGFVLNVEFLFYSILSRLAVHRDLSGTEKRRNKQLMKRQLNELQYWIRVYQGNHKARYLLARAEYDAQFNGGKLAPGLYREAMEFAQRQGNLALEALANLLAARFHRADRKLSGFYASEAAGLYRKWGASALAAAVAAGWKLEASTAENPAGLSEDAASSEMPPAAKTYADDRDILSHLGRIEKMDEDEGYLYLLDLLIRRGDVDYCAVFFEKTEDMYLKYEQRKTSGPQIHQEPINMNHLSGFPHKIIRYAARTETEILLGTKDRDGLFANDPYLAAEDQLSLACLPLRYAGVLAGIIYLEKTDGEGLGGSLPSFVKGFVPALLAKRVNGSAIFTELRPESPAVRKTEELTGRELEVLRMVAKGMSNSEISKKLYITLGTVRNHLSSIYAKLEVDNRVKAVMRAKELQIIHL
ncbi:helix-turn-helix transcriptional regulator [Candidatus Formimonas warabiya]|uniref:HTH luxR-type domain-containing protein n=1 Tax=Formimonas warabiya TaxID=1761012 RepID=A0A3G1KM10_FORW1|nr:helix-turn-helix transcriptional regulator [Candidatus Formimonas warabiya]ATW23516.1 hypothetical protein DCMF_00750 [Candidatus Formimonas warabiya]